MEARNFRKRVKSLISLNLLDSLIAYEPTEPINKAPPSIIPSSRRLIHHPSCRPSPPLFIIRSYLTFTSLIHYSSSALINSKLQIATFHFLIPSRSIQDPWRIRLPEISLFTNSSKGVHRSRTRSYLTNHSISQR